MGKSSLNSFISFYDKVTHLVDQGNPVDVIFLNFRKAFSTASHSIFPDKMSNVQLDKRIIQWVNNWLMGWAWSVIVNGFTLGWWPVIIGILHASILGPVLLKVFIHNLDAGIKRIISLQKKLGGTSLRVKRPCIKILTN